MNNPDHNSESLEKNFGLKIKKLKFFNADPGWKKFGSGMVKKSGSGSGMNNPAHNSESLETIFWVKILIFFEADLGSGMEKIRIRDGIYSDSR
jgi:hypothetical protein